MRPFSQGSGRGGSASITKRISFSSLHTPKESLDSHFVNKFFELSRSGLDENNRFLNRSAKSRTGQVATLFSNEIAASEVGKDDIHQKIIGKLVYKIHNIILLQTCYLCY
jgi:hypothetical protein